MFVAQAQDFDHEYRRSMQMALNELTTSKLVVDGVIGPKTVAVLRRFQSELGLRPSGQYDVKTQNELEPFIERKYLRGSDYVAAAELIGCKVSVMRAVVDVEACGDGFFSNGKAILWFERHLFHGLAVQRKTPSQVASLQARMPDVMHPEVGGYCLGDSEYQRFAKAASIDSDAAMRCTRWGMFQMLGSKHKVCGYDSVTGFISAMQYSERNQLMAFAQYLRAQPIMADALKNADMKTFARMFNGPKFKENNFHVKLVRAMLKHEKKMAKLASQLD